MKLLIIAILFLTIMVVVDMAIRSVKKENPKKADLSIKVYKSKWMFSMNEKDAFRKLKEITDPLGYYLFAKVRLLDLVEPISGNKNYRIYMNKIQSKHVDFVICDQKLVARCIVELDDNSHNRKDRQERDAFVDEVLSSTGYSIIHTKAITSETEQLILSSLNLPETQSTE